MRVKLTIEVESRADSIEHMDVEAASVLIAHYGEAPVNLALGEVVECAVVDAVHAAFEDYGWNVVRSHLEVEPW